MISKLKSFLGLSNNTTLLEAKKKKEQWEAMANKTKFLALLIVVVFEVFFFYYLAKVYGIIDEPVANGDKIAVVDFNKEVTQKYVNTVIKQLEDIKEDKEYLEVLFIMNSPGGSPTASEELSEYLKDYVKDKNVTMYLQSIAASGGYYIASSIKPVYSNKNAIVGSIGVIMPHYNMGKLAENIGIEEDDLSAGKYKKPVSFFKEMSEEDKKYLKDQMLTPTYNNFIQAVADNRGVSIEEITPYTEGKIYIANDKEIKGILVDEVTVLHKLKNKMKKKYKQKVTFIEMEAEKKNPLLEQLVKFDVSLDMGSDFRPTLK